MKKITKYFMALVAVILGVFTITSCSKDDEEKFTGNAKELINKLIVNEDREEVAGDFTVPGHITYKDVTVDLTWKSENETALKFSKQDDGSYLADVTQQEKNTAVEFSASLTYNDETASKSFKVMVARFIPVEEALENFYFNANKGAAVELTGWIAYMSPEAVFQGKTQRNFYILHESGLGGFYAYQTFVDADVSKNLKIGDPVVVKGEVDEYNGARQIGSSGSLALNEDLEANTNITKKDVTNDFIINDKRTMTLNTSIYATLSGIKVKEVKELDLSGEKPSSVQTLIVGERAGQEVNFVTTKYLTPYDTDDKTAQNISDKIKAEIQVGDYVTISGFSTWYNGTYQLQMISVDDISKDAGAPAISDAEKCSATISEALETVSTNIYYDESEIELPLKGKTYNDVTLSYSLNSEEEQSAISLAENVLTITPGDELVSATLVVTATVGSSTLSREITLSTQKVTSEFLKYLQAEKDAEAKMSGVVTHIENNFALIQSDEGAAYVYYRNAEAADKEAILAKLKVGQTVSINGIIDIYNDLRELKIEKADNITVQDEEVSDLPLYKNITNLVAKKTDLTNLQASLVYADGTCEIEVIEQTDKDPKYNYYLNVDGTNKILVYGNTSSMVEGQTYRVFGYLNWFNNPQISPFSASDIHLLGASKGETAPTTAASFEIANATIPGGDNYTYVSGNYVNLNSYFPQLPEYVTLDYYKNESSNDMSLQGNTSSGGHRLYGSETLGNELVLSVEGKIITNIVINYDSGYAGGQLKINGLLLEKSGKDGILTSVINFNGGVNYVSIASAINKQVRITSIQVWVEDAPAA